MDISIWINNSTYVHVFYNYIKIIVLFKLSVYILSFYLLVLSVVDRGILTSHSDGRFFSSLLPL